MAAAEHHPLSMPFASDQECIAYLFGKRWPWGFKCPFCGTVQQDMAPALTVVCRLCRRQTSITANTLLHGSKKSLVAWMRVGWQFCCQDEGLSARELQRIMALSSYQTAWNWLQKLRRGAALAEADPCRDRVLLDLFSLPCKESTPKSAPKICMALELGNSSRTRVRFAVLDAVSCGEMTAAVNRLVAANTTLLLPDHLWLSTDCRVGPELWGEPTKEQRKRGRRLLQQTVSRFTSVYRKAVSPGYLQEYLDEFSFRHNTASWPDRQTVLDHLLTGLMTTVKNNGRQLQAPGGGDLV